ncbi:MAG: hypothetical protein J0M26_28260 [Planctomycetes bacterium]|nr:hypothetical protein [Planctomycetota bacterium]
MLSQQYLVAALVGLCGVLGCNQSDSGAKPESNSSLSMDMPPPATVEVHSHPTEGPHHGTLIELGKEEYHAELVHDDKTVTIYILDSAAKAAVPIDAQELVINLVHAGKPEQFKLAASPDAGDPSGKSSRFSLQDAELIVELEHDHAAAKLSVLIGGKSYRGDIKHNHEGHDHAH